MIRAQFQEPVYSPLSVLGLHEQAGGAGKRTMQGMMSSLTAELKIIRQKTMFFLALLPLHGET